MDKIATSVDDYNERSKNNNIGQTDSQNDGNAVGWGFPRVK